MIEISSCIFVLSDAPYWALFKFKSILVFQILAEIINYFLNSLYDLKNFILEILEIKYLLIRSILV